MDLRQLGLPATGQIMGLESNTCRYQHQQDWSHLLFFVIRRTEADRIDVNVRHDLQL